VLDGEDGLVSLEMPFRLRGLDGVIAVDVQACSDPEQSGLRLLDESLPVDAGLGLPLCTATVAYPGQGYAAMMGWVQLVRSGDGEDPDRFEPDPLALLTHANTPYAFFGICPTLFDAPYRPVSADLCWQARSYLAVSPDAVMTPAVRPVAAFTWGFEIASGRVRIQPPATLALDSWSEHVDLLRATYPGWSFVETGSGGA
jgi:hypothetical protein